MLIVHEPTFYSDADAIDWVKDDPMYLWKLDWATRHNIVLWRIHDHWHAHKPDGIQTGENKALGWNQYLVEGSITRWKLPPTTLDELAKYVAKTLNTRSVRVIGDPKTRSTTSPAVSLPACARNWVAAAAAPASMTNSLLDRWLMIFLSP
jgi:hypothetical protein